MQDHIRTYRSTDTKEKRQTAPDKLTDRLLDENNTFKIRENFFFRGNQIFKISCTVLPSDLTNNIMGRDTPLIKIIYFNYSSVFT
jgi:hypothetical protein